MHERPQMEICESWYNCPWQYFEVLIAGSVSNLYSWLPSALFYLHRGTSHIRSIDILFSREALYLSFREPERMWRWPNLSVELRRQCFINPWIESTLFLIMAAVKWQCWVDFEESISAGHFDFKRLYYTNANRSMVSTMRSNVLAGINNCVSYKL